MELGLVNVKHFLTIFLNHSIGFLQIHMNKRYVQLFLLLYYKKSIKEKVQFEKEKIFDLSIEYYEELYIEMIVIPSLALLILVICIFYSNRSHCFQKGFRNKLEKLVFYIQE